MHLIGWDVSIVHWNDDYITDVDYWSHLGADLCFDPLFKTYLELTRSLCLANPEPSLFPIMKPKNMPYYCRPCIIPSTETADTSDAAYCQAIVSTMMINNCHGLCHLLNVPVQFSDSGKMTLPNTQPLHNDEFPCYAQQVLQFRWAMYSFQGGHFASAIQSCNLPFHINLAYNPYESGCSLIQEFTSCRQILGSATNMLNHQKEFSTRSFRFFAIQTSIEM